MAAVLRDITPERATLDESIAALRKALRARFPATRFSVTRARGTAYGFVSVRWTDGPTWRLVDDFVEPFNGERFDSMDDSSRPTYNLIPGTRKRSDIRGVSCSREQSTGAVILAQRAIRARFALPMDDALASVRFRAHDHGFTTLTLREAATYAARDRRNLDRLELVRA